MKTRKFPIFSSASFPPRVGSLCLSLFLATCLPSRSSAYFFRRYKQRKSMWFLSSDIPADVDERKKDKGSISQFLGESWSFFHLVVPFFFPSLLLDVRLIKVPELVRHEPCPYVVLPFSRTNRFFHPSFGFLRRFLLYLFRRVFLAS